MAQAKVWYSMTCPHCGKDCWGGENMSGRMRLRKNQNKFVCPRCGRMVIYKGSRNAIK